MNKIDKQLIEMVLKNHTYFQYGALMHVNDLDFAKDFVSQIKQSILKAIMEKKPKENEDYIGHIGNYTHKVYDSGKKNGYNYGIDKFESVIKEVLSK